MWSAVTNCLAAIRGAISGAWTVPNTVSRLVSASSPAGPGHGLQRRALIVGVAAIALPAADRQHEFDAGLVGQLRKRRQSVQFPRPALGTVVTARPDEQLAPNRPSFSRLALPIAVRSAWPNSARTVTPGFPSQRALAHSDGWVGVELAISAVHLLENSVRLLRERPQDRHRLIAGGPVLAAADPDRARKAASRRARNFSVASTVGATAAPRARASAMRRMMQAISWSSPSGTGRLLTWANGP